MDMTIFIRFEWKIIIIEQNVNEGNYRWPLLKILNYKQVY